MTGFEESRQLIAQGCRVLAARGLAEGFLGHISLRIDEERMLIRCRGTNERGLAWTEPQDIRLVDLGGQAAGPSELDGWDPPNELPLHSEVLRANPEVSAVVHAHPPSVVAADLAGLGIRPIIGSYDIPGAKLAAQGVPVYPRSVLVRTTALATEMVTAMGSHSVVLLRGHGLTTSGSSIQEAVLRAVSVNTIAALSLDIAAAGGTLVDIPEHDRAELPDLGPSFNEGVAWRHEMARLERGHCDRCAERDA